MPAPANVSNFTLDISTSEKANTTSENCLRLKGFIVEKINTKQLEFLAADIAGRIPILVEIQLLEKCRDSLHFLSGMAGEFANLEDDSDPLVDIRQLFDEMIGTSKEDGSYETINQLWASFLESGGEEFVAPAAPLLGVVDEPMPDA